MQQGGVAVTAVSATAVASWRQSGRVRNDNGAMELRVRMCACSCGDAHVQWREVRMCAQVEVRLRHHAGGVGPDRPLGRGAAA